MQSNSPLKNGFLYLLVFLFIPFSHANISGVMGPNIKMGDRSVQIRTAVSLADNDFEQDLWAYRMHYQHAFNDTFRARIVLQVRDKDSFEYDFFRTELLYNFKKPGINEAWSSALRFDLRTRRGSRTEEFAINWGNQWDLKNGYRARATLIFAHQFGNEDDISDIGVQTRASFSRKFNNGLRLGLQILNQHGALGDMYPADQKGIFIGPAVSGLVGDFKYEFRYLNGVTQAVRNHNVFFRITKAF